MDMFDKVLAKRFFDRFWFEFLAFLLCWNVAIGIGLAILFKLFPGS